MTRGLACVVSLFVLGGVTRPLFASELWPVDRRLMQGAGIRTGNFEVHPSLGGELGYDRNYFRAAGGAEPVIPALRLNLTPSIAFSTLGAARLAPRGAEKPRTTLHGSAHATYNELLPLRSKDADALANERDIALGADLVAGLLQGGPVSVDLMGAFERLVEPSNLPDPDRSFDRDTLKLGGGATWRPGGGLLSWRLGYGFELAFFERQVFANYSNARYALGTQGSWRFLPRTELVYDGSYSSVRYLESNVGNDGDTITSRAGLNGLVTKYFGLRALAGLAATFYTDRGGAQARNFDGVVGEASVTWYLHPPDPSRQEALHVGLSQVSAGFVRDVQPSYLGAFYLRQRGYGRAAYGIGGRVVLGADAGFARLTYPQSYFSTGELRAAGFSQTRIDAELFAEYRPSGTVGINTSLLFDLSLAKRRVPAVPGGVPENLDFTRFQAYLGARWFL